MIEKMVIPARFWQAMSGPEFRTMVRNGGYLNAEQCARLWHMEDYQGTPPKEIQVVIEEAAFERFLKTVKPLRGKP